MSVSFDVEYESSVTKCFTKPAKNRMNKAKSHSNHSNGKITTDKEIEKIKEHEKSKELLLPYVFLLLLCFDGDIFCLLLQTGTSSETLKSEIEPSLAAFTGRLRNKHTDGIYFSNTKLTCLTEHSTLCGL